MAEVGTYLHTLKPWAAWAGGLLLLLVGVAWTAPDAHAQTRAAVTGTVLDMNDGEPLAGANVALREAGSPEILDGTATNPDGTFALDRVLPGRYVLEVRFVGYQRAERTVTLEAGESVDLTIELQIETSSLDQVVISASRRQEKVLDAPASISVLEPEQIQQEVGTSTVEVLRSVTGVDMAQTGIDRREVVLRGFNEAFSGSAYVLTDYREAAVPSLAVNVHSIMPNMSLDVERVEVVRGPGSALYGPGVDGGVVHYFTKDPFEYPGTSVSATGGTRQFFSGQLRHAGVIGERLGYKVTAQYANANEWELDPSAAADTAEIARYRVYDDPDDVPAGRNTFVGDFDEDGDPDAQLRREQEYEKFNVNGLLQYRFGTATTLSLNTGFSQLKGPVQSGIGTLQADGFGYFYQQLRLQSGSFFAQGYVNVNDAGDDTYVYGSGDTVVDKSIQWNFQVQNDWVFEDLLNTQLIAGADADAVVPRTEGRILGRNEDDDQINAYGAYTQTTSDLSEQFALTLAARADYNNLEEEVRISPRAALVFKATPQNTFRASYNRSFSSPSTNSNFLDIEAQRENISGPYDLVFRGLGAADGFTFSDFRDDNEVTFSLPVQTFFGNDFNLNALPVLPMYGAVASQAIVQEDGGVRFRSDIASQLDAQVEGGLSAQQLDVLAQLFGYMGQSDNGNILRFFGQTTTDGAVLGIPDDSERGFQQVAGPTDIAPLKQTTTQTFEIGYKGLIGDRLLFAVDGYYETKENFIGPLVVESPLAYLQQQGLAEDVGGRLGQIFAEALSGQGDDTVAALLNNSGLPTSVVTQLLAGVVGSGLNGTPTGVVQPDQNILPSGSPSTDVGAFLSYRNFGQVEYWGIDITTELQATDALRMFANTSIVSDDFFDNEELDETDTALSVALNAPSFKVKSGFDFTFGAGFSVGMSGNYTQGFPVETGPYVGRVDDYFLLDARFGYRPPTIPGLRFDLTGKNILNNEHRQFVGAPELGAIFFGRITYTFPNL